MGRGPAWSGKRQNEDRRPQGAVSNRSKTPCLSGTCIITVSHMAL